MADDLVPLTDARFDSVLSALNSSLMRNGATGMGGSNDPFTRVEIGYGPLLGEQQLRALYRGSWFIRRVVELLPMDMIKAGVDIALHDGSNPRNVANAMQVYRDGGQGASPYSRRCGCGESFRKALVWARLFGMGYCVMRVNGGEDPAKPLEKVKSFEGLSVLDRYSLRPAVGSVNPDAPEFYEIARYESPGGWGRDDYQLLQRIHESRVLVFTGAQIHPFDIQIEGDGGHDSVIQQVYEAFARHFMAKDAISKGLDSYSLFKVAISGLSTLMQSPNGTETLTNYLNTVAQQMSLHRIIVQDTEASKSEFQERSFAGVAENFKFFVDELTASTGYPHYKIFGSVDKAGLSDSGGAESRAWAETVKAYQQMKIADNHRRLFHAIFEAVGRVPKQWEVTYPSIYQSTPEEESALLKSQADTLSTLTRESIITTRQAYQALATGQPLENVLEPLADDEVLNPVQEEAAAGPSAEEELAALLGGGGEAAPTAEGAPVAGSAEEELQGLMGEPDEDEPAAEADVDVEAEEVPPEDADAIATEEPPVVEDEPAAEAEEAPTEGEAEPDVEAVPDGEAEDAIATEEPPEPEDDGLEFDPEFDLEIDDGTEPESVEPDVDLDELEQQSDSADELIERLLGLRTDAPKGKGGGRKKRTEKPKCTKGRSCGMSCVPMKNPKTGKKTRCKDDLSPAADIVAKSVAASGGGTGNQNPLDPAVNPLNIPAKPPSQPKAPPKAPAQPASNPTPEAAPAQPKKAASKPKAAPKPKTEAPKPEQTPSDPPPLIRKRAEVPTDESIAIKNFKFIGDGIEGRVYVNPDTGEALKYFNPSYGLLKEEFFGNTIKAGELGLGPRLISVDPDYPVFSMEYLDGYTNGLNEGNQLSFLKSVRKAFDNDIPLDDLHEDNMMSKGNDIRFIDLGGESRFVPFSTRADTLLNKYGWRTLAANVVSLQAAKLPKDKKKEFDKLQKKYLRTVDPETKVSSLSEKESEAIVNRLYEIVGI